MKKILSVVIFLVAMQGNISASPGGFPDRPFMLAEESTAKVELYVTDWCPYCRRAIHFFQTRKIPVIIYDIEKDRDAARRKNELDSRRGVPFAIINGKGIHGFSEEAYQRALGSR